MLLNLSRITQSLDYFNFSIVSIMELMIEGIIEGKRPFIISSLDMTVTTLVQVSWS